MPGGAPVPAPGGPNPTDTKLLNPAGPTCPLGPGPPPLSGRKFGGPSGPLPAWGKPGGGPLKASGSYRPGGIRGRGKG